MSFLTFVQSILSFTLLMLLVQDRTFPKTAHIYTSHHMIEPLFFRCVNNCNDTFKKIAQIDSTMFEEYPRIFSSWSDA